MNDHHDAPVPPPTIASVEERGREVSRTAAQLLYHRLTAFPHPPKPNAKIPDYALPQVQMMAEAMMAVYQQGFRHGTDWMAEASDAIEALALMEPKP